MAGQAQAKEAQEHMASHFAAALALVAEDNREAQEHAARSQNLHDRVASLAALADPSGRILAQACGAACPSDPRLTPGRNSTPRRSLSEAGDLLMTPARTPAGNQEASPCTGGGSLPDTPRSGGRAGHFPATPPSLEFPRVKQELRAPLELGCTPLAYQETSKLLDGAFADCQYADGMEVASQWPIKS